MNDKALEIMEGGEEIENKYPENQVQCSSIKGQLVKCIFND